MWCAENEKINKRFLFDFLIPSLTSFFCLRCSIQNMTAPIVLEIESFDRSWNNQCDCVKEHLIRVKWFGTLFSFLQLNLCHYHWLPQSWILISGYVVIVDIDNKFERWSEGGKECEKNVSNDCGKFSHFSTALLSITTKTRKRDRRKHTKSSTHTYTDTERETTEQMIRETKLSTKANKLLFMYQ